MFLRTERFPKGTLIFKEGDTPEVPCMYDILTGRVGIYLNYGTPEQKLLTILELDSYFGEMSLLDHAPRSATAVALDDCILHIITEENLQQYFHERPSVVRQMVRHISSRLRKLTEQYMDICHTIAEREVYGDAKPENNELNQRIEQYASLWNEHPDGTHETFLYDSWEHLLH